MPATGSPERGGADRLVYVDSLRIVATAVIFCYHSARAFDDFERWHVKYGHVSTWFAYPMAVGSQFAMPLFWVLSGIATWTALQHHAPGQFVGRRLLRLGVPVVLVGWWVLCPPQVYVEATTDQHFIAPPFSGSYLDFLRAYPVSCLYGRGGWFPLEGLSLWYLTYLVLFTAASMPVFALLRSPRGRAAIARLGALAGNWWVLPALGLPVVAGELFVPASLPVLGLYQGGWRFATFWILLVLGFVLGADVRLRAAAERRRRLWLALALASLVPLLVWAPTILALPQGTRPYFLEWGLRAANGWLCLLALLGYGAHYLNRPARLLVASADLVLPFYIVHQTLIVLVVYGVRDWSLPVGPAWLLVIVTAGSASLAAALVIRRFRPLRFLFGLPVQVSPSGTTTPVPPPQPRPAPG